MIDYPMGEQRVMQRVLIEGESRSDGSAGLRPALVFSSDREPLARS